MRNKSFPSWTRSILLAILLLQLACSSVLGLGPQHMQQTHTIQHSHSSHTGRHSSSLAPLCASSGALNSVAAAHTASSLAGDPRIHITAVRLTGSCNMLRLLTGTTGSSSPASRGAEPGSPAAVLLSRGLAAHRGGSTAAEAAKAGPHQPANLAAAAAAAADTQGAPEHDPLLLHIDFTIAKDAPFFSDLVLHYSISEQRSSPTIDVSTSSTASPSIWIRPAGESSVARQLLVAPGGAAVSHHQHQHGGSSTDIERLLQALPDDGLSTLIDSVPALGQVSQHAIESTSIAYWLHGCGCGCGAPPMYAASLTCYQQAMDHAMLCNTASTACATCGSFLCILTRPFAACYAFSMSSH